MTGGRADDATAAGRARLRAHGELWNTFTVRRLDEIGVVPGWRCLEIGAGTGEVADWMLERVGPAGAVVVADIETRGLEPAAANIEVRHHQPSDTTVGQGYDVIHARLVLEHLTQRRPVLTELVAALRPGGYLVVEDYDARTMQLCTAVDAAWTTVARVVIDLLRRQGADLTCGQQLPRLLRDAGLIDVTSEGVLYPVTMDELAPIIRPAIDHLAPQLLNDGSITTQQLDDALGQLATRDESATVYTPLLVSATGRRRQHDTRCSDRRSTRR